MDRHYLIGKTLNHALKKYPQDINNLIELENPLNLDSGVLERKIIIGILANRINLDERELTITESKNLKWVKRIYPNLLKYRNFTIAIKFTDPERELLIKLVKDIRNQETSKIANIYRLFKFYM
jgi:hypothetical protein